MRIIDADALKRAIKTECNPYGKPTIDFESGKKVLEIIDNAPTVDTTFREVVAYECGQKSVEERPKGKWELFEKRPYHNLYMCSNCGHIIESMPDRLAENFKGCYCGADMRGDEE